MSEVLPLPLPWRTVTNDRRVSVLAANGLVVTEIFGTAFYDRKHEIAAMIVDQANRHSVPGWTAPVCWTASDGVKYYLTQARPAEPAAEPAAEQARDQLEREDDHHDQYRGVDHNS